MEKESNLLAVWMARAIGSWGKIDILPDRQAWHGNGYLPSWTAGVDNLFGTKEDRMILREWLKLEGMTMVKEWWEKTYPDQDKHFKYVSPDNKFKIEADPQRSYGYVYITAKYFKIGGEN